jgi:hypothetical protein
MRRSILKYLDKMPAAVSGCGGHNQTFTVACRLVIGFGLCPNEAMPYMQYYNQRCKPVWSERELAHKLVDANKQGGVRGYFNGKQSKGNTVRRFDLPDPRTIHL